MDYCTCTCQNHSEQFLDCVIMKSYNLQASSTTICLLFSGRASIHSAMGHQIDPLWSLYVMVS